MAEKEYRKTYTSWSLDNLAIEIVHDAHHRDMSRSTIGRILSEADLKPHRSVYYLAPCLFLSPESAIVFHKKRRLRR